MESSAAVSPLTESERQNIRKLVAKHQAEIPLTIRNFDIEDGEDSTGSPAIWISFNIRDEAKLSEKTLSRINDVLRLVKSDLFKAGINRWPYVRFRVST